MCICVCGCGCVNIYVFMHINTHTHMHAHGECKVTSQSNKTFSYHWHHDENISQKDYIVWKFHILLSSYFLFFTLQVAGRLTVPEQAIITGRDEVWNSIILVSVASETCHITSRDNNKFVIQRWWIQAPCAVQSRSEHRWKWQWYMKSFVAGNKNYQVK